MYNAVPPRHVAQELGLRPDAACPLCGTRETNPDIQREWVRCPMVQNKPIDLGCCLDHQGVARAEDFESDSYRDLFETLSRRIGRSVAVLRLQCLQHQQEIIAERLPQASSAESEELISLAGHVSRVAASIRP
jgi:hypothetical protein